MIKEKMLECMLLDKLLYTPEGGMSETHIDLEDEDPTCLVNMITRLIELEDEFINQYKLPQL